jgi:predicted ABC-type exoprotein transport system permease subunit
MHTVAILGLGQYFRKSMSSFFSAQQVGIALFLLCMLLFSAVKCCTLLQQAVARFVMALMTPCLQTACVT